MSSPEHQDRYLVGVRREPGGALVFCCATTPDLARGQRVRVAGDAGEYVATVAIPSDQIIGAPPLDDAPRVHSVEAEPEKAKASQVDSIPEQVVFLPADDSTVDGGELTRALALAALPIPAPPPPRR